MVGGSLLALLSDHPLAIVGMEQAGPELRVGLPLLGGVAEDLLDLWADVSPLAVLADLAGVDDRRQALDEAAVVLPRLGDLIQKLIYPVIGPLPCRRIAVHVLTIGNT